MACLAPKRFYLGVGTGEALNEYSSCGEWPGYNERRAQLQEAIELIRQLMTGEKITHQGLYYETHKAKLYTRPKEPVPIYVSSLVPNSAAFAGKYGDGLLTVGGEEPEIYKEMLKNFAAGAKEGRKNATRMSKMIEIAVEFTEDEETAIKTRLEYWAGAFVPAMFTERLYTPEASEQNGKVVGADTIRKAVCISADPNEHVKHAQRYIDLGFDHLIFHSAGPDQAHFLEAYGRDVLPRLRQKMKGKSKIAA
jgi:coenzyme F420-dependent glucose-6-phosphate dehydrogenase